eukprot:5728464-Amphidinium_carterae.1
MHICISGLVVEYIDAIDVTRVRFPADQGCKGGCRAQLWHGQTLDVKMKKDVRRPNGTHALDMNITLFKL